MRSALVFLVFFLPLAALLWWTGGPTDGAGALPAGGDLPAGEPVLTGEDFADETGATPFAGKVRELGDISVRIAHDGRIRYYFYVQDVARDDGTPQLESVTCAVFGDPGDEGAEHAPLRLTLEADAVTGDLPALVHGGEGEAKFAELRGRVVVRDAAGREIAQLDGARLDLDRKVASSRGPVLFRMPDEDVEVRGRGLEADAEFSRIRIDADIRASIRTARGPALLTTDGPITVLRDEEGGTIDLVIEAGAVLEHPLGSARCRRLNARLRRDGDSFSLERVTLEGEVRFDFDPLRTRGVEFVSLERVTLEGERRVVCEGPLHAVRRGKLAVLGLGERVVDIRAGHATVLLRRGAGKEDGSPSLEIEELRFERGLDAMDRNEGGLLRARVLTFVADAEEVDLRGNVVVETTDALVHADRIRVAALGGDEFDVDVRGAHRLEHVADGRLGALGEGTRGRLRLTARGPIRAHVAPGRLELRAERDVLAAVEADSSLQAQEMLVGIRDGKLARFEASRAVVLRLKERVFRGDRLVHEPEGTRAEGAPATLAFGDDQVIRARSFRVAADRSFVAEGDVFVRARPRQAGAEGPWTFRCARAEGDLPRKDRLPERVVATGPVRAEGPGGETLQADRAELRGELLVLAGAPARLARGKDTWIEAKRIEAKLRDGDVAEARTAGDAVLSMTAEKGDFARWAVELRGPARFAGDAVEVPGGAKVRGYDAKGRHVLTTGAGRVRVEVERGKGGAWQPRRLVADRGVVVESHGGREARVAAQRLVYEAGRRLVDVYGGVEVTAAEWPANVRFKHVVFLLTKDGIDLKRASDVDVRRPR